MGFVENKNTAELPQHLATEETSANWRIAVADIGLFIAVALFSLIMLIAFILSTPIIFLISSVMTLVERNTQPNSWRSAEV